MSIHFAHSYMLTCQPRVDYMSCINMSSQDISLVILACHLSIDYMSSQDRYIPFFTYHLRIDIYHFSHIILGQIYIIFHILSQNRLYMFLQNRLLVIPLHVILVQISHVVTHMSSQDMLEHCFYTSIRLGPTHQPLKGRRPNLARAKMNDNVLGEIAF